MRIYRGLKRQFFVIVGGLVLEQCEFTGDWNHSVTYKPSAVFWYSANLHKPKTFLTEKFAQICRNLPYHLWDLSGQFNIGSAGILKNKASIVLQIKTMLAFVFFLLWCIWNVQWHISARIIMPSALPPFGSLPNEKEFIAISHDELYLW